MSVLSNQKLYEIAEALSGAIPSPAPAGLQAVIKGFADAIVNEIKATPEWKIQEKFKTIQEDLTKALLGSKLVGSCPSFKSGSTISKPSFGVTKSPNYPDACSKFDVTIKISSSDMAICSGDNKNAKYMENRFPRVVEDLKIDVPGYCIITRSMIGKVTVVVE